MDFPIAELMDQDACYAKLLHWLLPEGLVCPRCGARDGLGVHRRHRAPLLDYRCKACHRVFNAFTGTALRGSKRPIVELMLILRGFAQGVPTAHLARELGCDRKELLRLRHRLQHSAWRYRDRSRLDDPVVEADEMYQNAGEKRHPAQRSGRPASAARQPPAGPRHVRERPTADRRGGGAGVGRVPLRGA
jgi:transposase-like protein